MQHFTLRVMHDAGYITIRTVASSEQAARELVCRAELCPARSIRRVYPGKRI
jgi:hypothetical protein